MAEDKVYVETKFVEIEEPVQLESGRVLEPPIRVAYEEYGKRNERGDNIILVCHALSGSAHAAFWHEGDGKPGWWDFMIGPGKPLDTNKYAVICSNVIGSCYGSTGPSSRNPKTGEFYALSFPVVTIRDMVNVQRKFLELIGVNSLLMVIGGSMGGMQALQWAVSYPDMVYSSVVIATTWRHKAMQIAFNEVGRYAIMKDPNFMEGNYYGKTFPIIGLQIARMIGHITYLSKEAMERKFGRELKGKEKYGYDFKTIDFEVESYLRYKGESFVKRFDANSYLYITKAIDYFDLTNGKGSLEEALSVAKDVKFLVVSFTSDWLYPPEDSKEIVKAMLTVGIDVTYVNLDVDYGHDSFLLDIPELKETIKG
ncbi:MAG: homoserine O-acetyltransferase, partial [candidate division WOR-3 bacterium]